MKFSMTSLTSLDNYVVLVTISNNVTLAYEVEGWLSKGTHLVPVYNGGMTPQDEAPMTSVRLEARTREATR